MMLVFKWRAGMLCLALLADGREVDLSSTVSFFRQDLKKDPNIVKAGGFWGDQRTRSGTHVCLI